MGQDSSKEGVGLSKNFDDDGVEFTFSKAAAGEYKAIPHFIEASASHKELIKAARDRRGRNLLMVVCSVDDPVAAAKLPLERRLQIERDRLEIVKYLLQFRLQLFDINEVAPAIPLPNEKFHARSHEVGDVFLQLGNDITALGFACSYKTETADVVEALLLEGANPNIASPSRNVTPLMLASAAQFPQAVAELLATNKVKPSAADSAMVNTPLHFLSFNGSPHCDYRTKQDDAVACAELLVAAGADIEAVNAAGGTPLTEAIANAPAEADNLVRYFIRAGCNVFGRRAEIRAQVVNHHVGRQESKIGKLFDHQQLRSEERICSTLVSEKSRAQIKPCKQTRLHEAILFGSVGVVEHLLSGGVSVDAICEIAPGFKVTPLQLACSMHTNTPEEVQSGTAFRPDDDSVAVEMARLLLRAGANADLSSEKDPDASNALSHFPPLFIAAANQVDSRALVKLLVEQGEANVHAEVDSLTPLHMAVRYNNYFVCDYFVNTLKIAPAEPERYQLLQEFIHATETNLANDVLKASGIWTDDDRQKLKNDRESKSLLSFEIPVCSFEVVRPFDPKSSAPGYEKINLQFISMLLPPKAIKQDAVIAPLHFNPQLFSLQIANNISNNTSKIILEPSPRNSAVSLAPEDRAKRIAFGLSSLNNQPAKATAEREIDRVSDFPGVYDGYEDGRLRELMASHNAQAEPTSDECFVYKLKQLENPASDEHFDKSKLTEAQKKDVFFARLFNFYQKYDPDKTKDEGWEKRTESVYYALGEDTVMMKLEGKYGPEPPFRFSLVKLVTAVPRTDVILSTQLSPQETIVSSAHRPNFGIHFPSAELDTNRTDQFFLHEFQLLIEKFEPERASRARLHAYIIVMRNTGKIEGYNCNLLEIYIRMWKQYNEKIIITTPESAKNLAFTPLPPVVNASDNNNNNRNCSYLLPVVEQMFFKAGGFTHGFAEQWKLGVCRSDSLRKLWTHLATVTNSPMVEPCAYQVPEWMDETWKARLTAFFRKYNPEKLPAVESTLTKFKGREEEMMKALVSKYGPESHPTPNWINDESEMKSNNNISNNKMFDPFTFESDESTSSWSSSSPPVSEAFRRRATEYIRSNSRSSTDLPLLDSILPQFVGNEFTFLKNYSVTRLGLVNGAKQVFTSPFTKRSFRIPSSCRKAASSQGIMLRVAPDQLNKKDRVAAFLQHCAPGKKENVESVMKNMNVSESQVLDALVTKYGPEPSEYVVPFSVASAGQRSDDADDDSYLQQVQRILSHYAPEKLVDVPSILVKYQGKEATLVEALVKKYGPVPNRAGNSSADYRSRLERFYQQYAPEKVPNVDATLQQYSGHEEDLFSKLVAKYGPEPEKQWPAIRIFTNSGMSLDTRLKFIAKNLPASASAHFGFNGKTVDEIVGLMKSGGNELRNICEGELTDADATRETTCDVEFTNDDDGVVTYVCLKYCVDEPKPAAPPLRNFLLPQLELNCNEGIILDAKLELLPNSEATAAGGGIDNLVIEIKALIRQNQVATPENHRIVVERKFQFLACDLGVENNQSVQKNNVDDDLTTEFSL